ncbi:elongation factor subfamily 1b subunit gamma, partial [Tanacetum coccineum]
VIPKAKPRNVEAPKPAVEEEEEAPKPKTKNPLDFLPTTSFHEVAIKRFWDAFDPEVYSLWFCIYKYNDENTVSAEIMKKLGEFLPRMIISRRYAFGKMSISGNVPPFKVKGLWLFFGPEIPHFLKDECYDMELYEWTKVDPSDETQKNVVLSESKLADKE